MCGLLLARGGILGQVSDRMLLTARRLESLQGQKGGSKLYILPNFDEK